MSPNHLASCSSRDRYLDISFRICQWRILAAWSIGSRDCSFFCLYAWMYTPLCLYETQLKNWVFLSWGTRCVPLAPATWIQVPRSQTPALRICCPSHLSVGFLVQRLYTVLILPCPRLFQQWWVYSKPGLCSGSTFPPWWGCLSLCIHPVAWRNQTQSLSPMYHSSNGP